MEKKFFSEKKIEGRDIDRETFREYMISIANDITEELNKNFPIGNPFFHVYKKLNLKKNFFKIFVYLLSGSDINPRSTDVKFLISVNGGYPSVAPMVFCISDVSQYKILFFLYIIFSFVMLQIYLICEIFQKVLF